MYNRYIKTDRIAYGSAIGLLLVTILTTAAAQPPSDSASQQGAGQDCTSDASICTRGLLCLPNFGQAAGGRLVCRQPRENEVCDQAAPCEGSDANGPLACLPKSNLIPHTGEAINFPGKICLKAVGRGRSCDFGISCLPGLSCIGTGLLSSVCIFAIRQASLGQDCSKFDCAGNLLCKRNSDGSKECVNLIPEGQSCDPKDYELAGNPCSQSAYVVACIKGICARALPPGASCTTLEDPRSWSIGQCDTMPLPIGSARPKCLKSETGDLKCLVPAFELGLCGDSDNIGCGDPDAQCINGYCGIPRGGQGDLCEQSETCKPGLICFKSPRSGAGSRCSLQPDAGYICDSNQILGTCKDGMNCTYYNGQSICLRGPVPLGGKCVAGETECASGLTCVPNGFPDLGFEGVCMQLSSIGSPCDPSKFHICDGNRYRDLFRRDSFGELPLLECMDGRCVNSTVGLSGDPCGDNTGRTCARQDPISKFQLECAENSCAYVNGSTGHPCSFGSQLASRNYGCAAGLYCSAVNHAPSKTNLLGSSTVHGVFKCVQYVLDGERCDYNKFIGCRNRQSSCVRGVCTSS
jgi:hypothetical protein